MPTEEEIWGTIKGMNKEGAPGPDGFGVAFYIFAWDIIKEDLCRAIADFFKGFQLPRSWSATTLILIPKVKMATRIDQLRPISLCNVCHKIISRILSNRLGSILPMIISKEQVGFVPGRNIHQNISLAHDLAHDLHKKERRHSNVIIKLDMAKAYDRVSWSFLIRSMRACGFCENWCDLIYRCIANNWYSVCWENRMFGFFKSSCGVRQGDPLSPGLFTIAMEWLSRRINNTILTKNIRPYSTKKGAVTINHLLFADDILLFSTDEQGAIGNLMGTLNTFCDISGQKLNPRKSQIFFSKHTPQTKRDLVLQITGFKEDHLPTKYLGAPLFQGRVKKTMFAYLLEAIQTKVNGWMANMLSAGGRITLIKAVLSSMSLHVIAVLPIPKTMLRRMDILIANFLWGQGDGKRHHWVGIDRVCKPTSQGGLGIISLADFCRAFRGKLAWQYLKQDNLWSKFTKSRFVVGRKGSPIWNHVSPHIERMRSRVLLDYGDGTELIDRYCWLYNIPCRSNIKGKSIAEVLREPGIRHAFVDEVPSSCEAYYTHPLPTNSKAQLRWLDSKAEVFCLKQYRSHISRNHGVTCWGKNLWRSWLPGKISFFVWRLILNALPLDSNIVKCGICMVSRCSCCEENAENTEHLFFRGKWASMLWEFLDSVFDNGRPVSVQDFIDGWISPARMKSGIANLSFGVASCGLWEIWLARNRRRNDESKGFCTGAINHWAKNISVLLPGLRKDTGRSRRILFNLGVPYTSMDSWLGSWRRWRPFEIGITMDIYIPSYVQAEAAGVLCRTKEGAFVYGFGIKVKEILCRNDLIACFIQCVDRVRRKGITVEGIQCSHYLMFNFDYDRGWFRPWREYQALKSFAENSGIKQCRRVHQMLLHAAVSVACSQGERAYVDRSELPRSVKLATLSDQMELPVFCHTEGGWNRTPSLSSQDDSSMLS